MIVISSLSSKKISNRLKDVSSFFKVITFYPLDTLRDKKPDFPLTAKILSVLLICFYLALFIFYYKIGLSNYIIPWSGTVERIEYKSPATSNMPDISVVQVLRDGNEKKLELYQMTQKKINELGIVKGVKVRKPFLYTETLFGTETISYSYMLSDFLFFIFGMALFVFAAITGGSFLTIIYASVFMTKSKYIKK